MWDKRATIIGIHDGDTLTAVLDQGFRQTTEITVRLLGVFAPELKQVGGPESLAFVRDWVSGFSTTKWPFVVTTIRGPKSDREITTLERYVAVVETIDHSHNLNIDVAAFVKAQGYGGGIGG